MGEVKIIFGALVIDNTNYKDQGYRFDEGILSQIKQFKDSQIKVIQTDVVHNETIKHLAKNIDEARAKISQGLRSAKTQLKISKANLICAEKILSVDGSSEEFALDRIEQFYENVGVELIQACDYIDISRLMDMYFNLYPPFEARKDKKAEFPDAIALLTIEKWAIDNNLNVVAVSADKGWSNFSEGSDHIFVFDSISKALEKFQPEEQVKVIVENIQQDIALGLDGVFSKIIEDEIVDSIGGYDIEVEADSQFYYEVDYTSAEYTSHDFNYNEYGLLDVEVVRIDDDSVTIKVVADVSVDVEASFDFTVRDSIDKDYISVGSCIAKKAETYETDILITFTGAFEKNYDNIDIIEVDVIEEIAYAKFGEIEPNWMEDDIG